MGIAIPASIRAGGLACVQDSAGSVGPQWELPELALSTRHSPRNSQCRPYKPEALSVDLVRAPLGLRLRD